MSVFRSAISSTAEDVDPGYLALYWSLVGWSVSSLAILITGVVSVIIIAVRSPSAGVIASMMALAKDHPEQIAPIIQAMTHADQIAPIIQATGIALGAVAGTFATVVGAVGLFRMGDKPHAGTITTTAQVTQTTTGAQGAQAG